VVYAAKSLVIATKGGLRETNTGVVRDANAKWIRAGVEESLRALATDYVDLFQVHWPDPKTPFDETAGATRCARGRGQGSPRGRLELQRLRQMETFSSHIGGRDAPAPATTSFTARSKPRLFHTLAPTTSGSWSMGLWRTGS